MGGSDGLEGRPAPAPSWTLDPGLLAGPHLAPLRSLPFPSPPLHPARQPGQASGRMHLSFADNDETTLELQTDLRPKALILLQMRDVGIHQESL